MRTPAPFPSSLPPPTLAPPALQPSPAEKKNSEVGVSGLVLVAHLEVIVV